MATIPTTELDLLNANIRIIMRQLRKQLATGDISKTYNLDADIIDRQVDKARELLFNGATAAPIDSRTDPNWITRFNLAIAQGDQEKAIKILVDKENRILLSWQKHIFAAKKYIVHYKQDYASLEYNGTGLMFNPDSVPLTSPFEISDTHYKESSNTISLELFSNTNAVYEFAIQGVDEDGQIGAMFPLYKYLFLSWEKNTDIDIIKYQVSYSIQGQPGYGLFLVEQASELATTFEVPLSSLQNVSSPTLHLYTPIFNANYTVNITAIDSFGNSHPVTNFKLEQRQSQRNEYCELLDTDIPSVFGDQDKIDALLWYFNYIFFLDNQNWWNASRMVVERKNRNTIFPKTSPWFFPPILKDSWERQESADQFVTYLKQNIRIPIMGHTAQENVQVGTLNVYQNLIDDYVFVEISGTPNDLDVYLSTSILNEEYHNINSIADLAFAMRDSKIGTIAVDPNKDNFPLTWMPFRSYARDKITVTRQQENIFIYAYFGDEENTRNARQYTSLNPSPRRRIRMEKWENTYLQWLEIHVSLVETWIAIFSINPLGLLLDVDAILRKNIKPNTLSVMPIGQPDNLPNEISNTLVNIIKEDDALTPSFLQQMSDIYTYLVLRDPKTRNEKRDSSLMTRTLNKKADILNRQNNDDYLDIFRLPYGWDLQRVALVKLNETLYWVDVADFNDIANPLDDTEVFEGRVMALPKAVVLPL